MTGPTTPAKPARSAAAKAAAANGADVDETLTTPAPTGDDAVEVELPPAPIETADISTANIEVEHEEEAPAGAPPPRVEGGVVRVRIRHKRGCPKNPNRIEKIPGRTPPDRERGLPGIDVVVVRCVDCGEADVAGNRQYDDDET